MDEYYSLYKKALEKTRGKKRLWYLENGYNSEAEKSSEEEEDEEGSETVSEEEKETAIPGLYVLKILNCFFFSLSLIHDIRNLSDLF